MSQTILVADDSKTIRQAVEIAFEKEPYDVVTVEDGNTAIAKAKEMMPAVVIADHVMPGQDGYAVAQALKADPATANIPVLLLSGTAAAFDEARCTAAGAVGHIKKPFECTQLINRVRESMGEVVEAKSTSPFAHLKPFGSSTPPVAATPEPAAPATPASPFVASSPPPGQENPFAGAPNTPAPAAISPAPVAQQKPDPFGLGAAPAAVPVAAPVPEVVTTPAVAAEPAPAAVAQAAVVDVSERLAQAGVSGGAVDAATREIIERVVWEVVPELAETIIREELARLLANK